MSNMRAHCAAMVAVVMLACVFWLRGAPLLWPTPLGTTMTSTPVNDAVAPAIFATAKHLYTSNGPHKMFQQEYTSFLLARFHGREHGAGLPYANHFTEQRFFAEMIAHVASAHARPSAINSCTTQSHRSAERRNGIAQTFS